MDSVSVNHHSILLEEFVNNVPSILSMILTLLSAESLVMPMKSIISSQLNVIALQILSESIIFVQDVKEVQLTTQFS